MNRYLLKALGLLCLALAWGAQASAPEPLESIGTPDASFRLTGGVIALGVGYEWARGTLSYQGREVPFWVRGISVMDLGAGRIRGEGEVFNLKALADFEGRYVGSSFGSALARGGSIALIKNEHGVAIRSRSSISGVRLNFSGNGVQIRLSAPAHHSEKAP